MLYCVTLSQCWCSIGLVWGFGELESQPPAQHHSLLLHITISLSILEVCRIMILLSSAVNQISPIWVIAQLVALQLFLMWVFGHDIDWPADLLISLLVTAFWLCLPLLVGLERADQVVMQCFLAARCASVVHLLDWGAWWQVWPWPSLLAMAAVYCLHLVVAAFSRAPEHHEA